MANSDGHRAFECMGTYDPLLLWFCENLMADMANEVEELMNLKGIKAEELGVVESEFGEEEKRHHYLHKLRCERCEWAAEEIVKNWFERLCGECGKFGCGLGESEETMAKNGGVSMD